MLILYLSGVSGSTQVVSVVICQSVVKIARNQRNIAVLNVQYLPNTNTSLTTGKIRVLLFVSNCILFPRNVDGEFDLESLPYDVILLLRLLLLREKNTEDWQTFISLASLLEEWKKMDPWEENQLGKIKIIREDLGLTQFSHQDILTVWLVRPKLNIVTDINILGHWY